MHARLRDFTGLHPADLAQPLVLLQLYNEEVNDLIQPKNRNLHIKHDAVKETYVAGLTEHFVLGPEQAVQIMEAGDEHRHVGETRMNDSSSRSHSIFKMVRA